MVTKDLVPVEFTSDEVGINCVSTVEIARLFGREHKSILRQVRILRAEGRMIDAMSAPLPKSGGAELAPSDYKDERGKRQPMHLLTEFGCATLIGSLNFTEAWEKQIQKQISQEFIRKQIKLLKSVKPKSPKGKYGYVAAEEGDKEHHYKRVLREGRTDKELDEGKMLHLHYSGTGMFASRDAVRCFTYRKDGTRIEQLGNIRGC